MSSEGYMAKVNKQIPSAYVDAWKRDALHLGSEQLRSRYSSSSVSWGNHACSGL